MKGFYASIILFIVTFHASASIDTLKTDSTKTSLILATIYSSNANYYGQTSEGNLPYILSNSTLSLKNGLFISASAYKLLNTGPLISAVDLSAGIDFNITKKLSGGLVYTSSFFSKNSPFIQATNDKASEDSLNTTTSLLNTLSGKLNYDWNWFKSEINTSYAFGSENDVFLSLNNTKLFDLGSINSQKDYISL